MAMNRKRMLRMMLRHAAKYPSTGNVYPVRILYRNTINDVFRNKRERITPILLNMSDGMRRGLNQNWIPQLVNVVCLEGGEAQCLQDALQQIPIVEAGIMLRQEALIAVHRFYPEVLKPRELKVFFELREAW